MRTRLFSAQRYQNLFFMGDSLTIGVGSTGGQTYPQQVAASYPTTRWYYNGGQGGNTSSQILTRYLALGAGYKSGTLMIWAGRNNSADGAQVQADIAAMVAEHNANGGGNRYLVLSIDTADGEAYPSANYDQITALNSALSATYGVRYVDVLALLVAQGAPDGAYPDPVAYAGRYPPAGVRDDAVHLNNIGYGIVAAAVYAKIAAFGW